jgi:hypothetical protein
MPKRRVWVALAIALVAIAGSAIWLSHDPRGKASAPVASAVVPSDTQPVGSADVFADAPTSTQRAAAPTAVTRATAPPLPPINPKIVATTQVFKPFAQARTHAELLAMLERQPVSDAKLYRESVIEPISQWCTVVWSAWFDEASFQRSAPGRFRAIGKLREFCGNEPAKRPELANPPITPLGTALLTYYARAAGQNREVRNLFDLGIKLAERYRSGQTPPPAHLGCEFGCAGAFSAATMILACGTVGGCGPDSALALGFCATGFLPEGCRANADYMTALRDRYSAAEWQRVEWAIQVLGKELQ